MKCFKDCDGRQWYVKLNLDTLERVEASTGVALDDIASANPASVAAVASAVTLGKVLWAIVEPDAAKRGVAREQFFASMGGDEIDAARKVLLDEQIFFSPPAWREPLMLAIQETEAAQEKALKEEAERRRQSLQGNSALNSQELLESIPVGGVSAS
jgi:hypothetical protein